MYTQSDHITLNLMNLWRKHFRMAVDQENCESCRKYIENINELDSEVILGLLKVYGVINAPKDKSCNGIQYFSKISSLSYRSISLLFYSS